MDSVWYFKVLISMRPTTPWIDFLKSIVRDRQIWNFVCHIQPYVYQNKSVNVLVWFEDDGTELGEIRGPWVHWKRQWSQLNSPRALSKCWQRLSHVWKRNRKWRPALVTTICQFIWFFYIIICRMWITQHLYTFYNCFEHVSNGYRSAVDHS